MKIRSNRDYGLVRNWRCEKTSYCGQKGCDILHGGTGGSQGCRYLVVPLYP